MYESVGGTSQFVVHRGFKIFCINKSVIHTKSYPVLLEIVFTKSASGYTIFERQLVCDMSLAFT